MNFRRLWALTALAALFYPTAATVAETPARAAAADAAQRKATIVVGRVSGNPRSTYPKLDKFAGYLAHKLRPLGITRGEVRIVRSSRQMIRLLQEGKIDFLSETIMSALLMQERAKAEILLREWKKKRGWYWSIIIARSESNIRGLPDLRGRKIAFEDPGSTVSFLVPLALLHRAGLQAVRLKSFADPVPPGKVGYVFADKEINIAAWVERGFVDAGALSNWDWRSKRRTPRSMREDMEIVFESRPLIRSVFVARAGLPEALKRRTKEILLGMDRDQAGKRILKSYFKVKKYDEITGEVAESLEETRKLYSLIRDRIG
ncbi:MAG: phosphate/phosphite/phosphonate ABC transporter substrate-binding protein [Rhodospirillales bacterium]